MIRLLSTEYIKEKLYELNEPDPDDYQQIADELYNLASQLADLGEHLSEVMAIESCAGEVEMLVEEPEPYLIIGQDGAIVHETSDDLGLKDILENRAVVLSHSELLACKEEIYQMLGTQRVLDSYKREVDKLKSQIEANAKLVASMDEQLIELQNQIADQNIKLATAHEVVAEKNAKEVQNG